MPTLFDELTIGDIKIRNRIVMAPLTRLRAGESKIPNALMVEYYRQRASAGLILSEGVPISQQGVGYAGVPGIWLKEHVEGWKSVTKAVKAEGGTIFMQIWHVGRVSDPTFQNGGAPVSASAVTPDGHVSLLRPQRSFVEPRPLSVPEINGIVDDFRRGSQFALEAGFDGVELHGANGYLLDQFLQDSTNLRTDEYGGPIENRARLLLEATDAAISVWGAGRVGVHLAPRAEIHSMGDTNLPLTFGYVAEQLGAKKIAFICAREKRDADSLGPDLKKKFGGTYIANEGFTKETAQVALSEGWADAVAFGKDYIANPDLVDRFRTNASLNEQDKDTFYASGAEGYTDYPVMASA